MTTVEIENMTADDIKAKRAEAIAAAKSSADLPARYVATLIDAKTRDEKLGEQGRTITAMQDALAAAKETAAKQVELLQKANGELAQLTQSLSDSETKIMGLASDAATYRELAKARRVALAGLQMTIAPLLAAE